MKSILIAVGCDQYDSLNALSGAEGDARRVFAALTAAGQPYSPGDSRLLLSPTRAQLDQALSTIAEEPVEVLTFYFAGHGGVKDGAYYFCMRDSRPERLSTTGFPLNSWLNIVRELKPRYAYLITDSCHSGGTHHDIRDVLSDPRLGQHSASTFVCLAAASANQYAQEIGGIGLMTAELLKVFDGRLTAGSEVPELDLTEVARVVGRQFAHLAEEQRPVAWGLNLFGSGKLCRNPHYAKSPSSFHVPQVPNDSPLGRRITAHSDELWELYRSAAKGVDLERVRTLVTKVSMHADVRAGDRSAFIYETSSAIAGLLETSGSPWDAAEVLGGFAGFLLRDLDTEAAAAKAWRLMVRKVELELGLIAPTLARLEKEPTTLLNAVSPMADFYFLPQRLLKLIATVAQAVSVAPELGLMADRELALRFVTKILAEYPLAFRVVTDEQAPTLFLWSHYARRLEWQEQLEQVFGSLFTDYVSIRGKVTRCGLPPKQACEYVLARGKDPEAISQGWLANPGQLLAVYLIVAGDNGLEATVDKHLEELDQEKFNLYFPGDYALFADEAMEGGVNRTHAIGMDTWTCADFARLFGNHWAQHLAAAKFPRDSLAQLIVNSVSMCFPDRVALSLRRERTT